jgi:hypothetical protein
LFLNLKFWIFKKEKVKQNLKNETEIETELELEKWLKDNCYPMNQYSINGNFIYEGCGLENNSGIYQWYFIERGIKTTIKYFATEKDAVKYALKEIKADEHAKLNQIGIFKEKEEIERIISELEKREVEYSTDKIPYGGINDWRTRIFVSGCEIKKVGDLIQNGEKTA